MQLIKQTGTFTKITYLYNLPRRSTNKVFINIAGKPVYKTFFTAKGKNTSTMFLRSPKHFKTGKQIVFFLTKTSN